MMAARLAGVLILGGCVSYAGLVAGLATDPAYAQTASDAAPAQSTPAPAIIPPAISAPPAPAQPDAVVVPVQPPVAAVPEAPALHPPKSRSQRAQERDRDSGSGLPADGATADNNVTAGEGRYTFLRSGEGFMRLDNRNGEVAFCSKRAVGWACQMLPEDRAALESEIARLQRQNATLKKELVTRGIALPNTTEPVPPPVAQNDRNPKIPGDADVARMKSMVGDMWQRLVEMIARLQADALKKS